MVGVAQHFLPEPPTGRQQWVIGYEELIVFLGSGETGVLEMTGQFSLIGIHAFRDGRLLFRLFTEDGFANHTFDIGIRKLYLDSKSSLESLQAGRLVAQRRLSGADEKKALL